MDMVSGPVVAIGLVLSAVFIPCAFISGIIGQFFRQFALTIAVSTIISAFNSLTLSPALAAILLRSRKKGSFEALPWLAYPPIGAWIGHKIGLHWLISVLAALHLHPSPTVANALGQWWAPIAFGALAMTMVGLVLSRPLNFLLGWSFRQFNCAFDYSTGVYTQAVSGLLRVSLLVLIVYGGLLALTYWGFTHTPTGFIPAQDKGYLLVNVQLPDASSVVRTEDVVQRIEKIARGDANDRQHYPGVPGIRDTVAISGQSILLNANAPNFGALYLMLDDFDKRTRPSLSADAIAATLQDRLRREVPEAVVNIFGAPPVEGLGTAGGFKIIVQDRGDNTLSTLQEKADKVVAAGNADPRLQGVFTSFRADTPWLELIVNRTQAKDKGRVHRRPPDDLGVNAGAVLHQRLQPFRPHLASECASSRSLPRGDRGH